MKDITILQNFLDVLKAEEGLADNTLVAYENDISNFFEIISSGWEKANSDDIRKYLKYLSKKKLAPRTIARKISSIRHFFRFIYTEGLRNDDPTINIENPKAWRTIPKPLSKYQVDLLLSHAKKNKEPEGLRLNAFLELFYATGMRVSELLGLKLSQTKRAIRDKRFLRVRGKGDKERIVPLTPTAIEGVLEYAKVMDELLFSNGVNDDFLFPNKYGNKPLTRQRIWQLLKDLAREIGIDESTVSPHVLRHSFATHLLSNGMDLRTLQELLGHSNITTTQIYTAIADDAMQSLVNEHHPLMSKK